MTIQYPLFLDIILAGKDNTMAYFWQESRTLKFCPVCRDTCLEEIANMVMQILQ